MTTVPVSRSPLPSSSSPDLAAIKTRQQATWASGDFSVVAARIVLQAEQLCETADLQAAHTLLAEIASSLCSSQ